MQVDVHELLPYTLQPIRAFGRLGVARTRAAQAGELPHRVDCVAQAQPVVVVPKRRDRLVPGQTDRLTGEQALAWSMRLTTQLAVC